MKKTLINNRFFLIALFVSAACFVIFRWIETSQSEDALTPQVKFIAAKIDLSHPIINKNPQPIVAYEQHKKIEIVAENKNENSSLIKNIKPIGEYLSSFHSELLMAADLQQKFDADEIDSVAANQAERDLSYVFYQGMEWQEFSPQEISCKSNMCRVKLVLSSEEKNNKLTELISNEMKESKINYSLALPVKLPVEGYSYFYFVKGSLLGALPRNN